MPIFFFKEHEMKKSIVFIVVLLVAAMSVFAAGQTDIQVGSPITYTDIYGYTTTLDAVPERIVSLGPNLSDTMAALGQMDKLVGRTDYCNWPEEILEIPSVGDMYNINMEVLASLDPDAVICSSIVSEQSVNTIRGLGIPVIIINGEESLDDTYGIVRDLGYVLGCQDEAEALVTEMKERIGKITDALEGVPAVSCYYCVGYGEYGDFTATGDTFINGIIEACGGENIAKNGTNWSFSKELLVAGDPEMIIFPEYSYSSFDLDKANFSSMEPYSSLSAVKNGQLYKINSDLMDRQGARTAEAVETLAAILHPEVFGK